MAYFVYFLSSASKRKRKRKRDSNSFSPPEKYQAKEKARDEGAKRMT